MRLNLNNDQFNLTRVFVSILGMFALITFAACSSGDDPQPTQTTAVSLTDQASPAAPTVRVVATTSIVSDWAKNVGGDHVEVFSLLPVGGDPHSWQPSPGDVARITDADLVLSVGLGLEASWLEELVRNASMDESKIVALGDLIDPIEFVNTRDHRQQGFDHGPFDPHFWFDSIRVKLAITGMAARLSVLDSDGGDIYRTKASEYSEQLDELHAWIQQQIGVLPSDRKLLVTSHDSLSYFAQLYGFEVVGTVLPAGLTETEPSAEDLAKLIGQVQKHGVRAVFGETTVSERLANAVTTETGTQLIPLYSGSLGPEGSGAETYIGMFRTNVERIVEALR